MMTVDDVLLGGLPRGSLKDAVAFFIKKGSKRLDEVVAYLGTVYDLAPQIMADPAMIIAQSSHETDYFTSYWWIHRLNPAGIGITGDDTQNRLSRVFQSGEEAAHAHVAHYQLYANGEITKPLDKKNDPRYTAYIQAFGNVGMAQRLSDFGSGVWAADPEYAGKVVKHGNEIFKNLEYQVCKA